MTITGLENNYYLSQNDIWISVNGFSEPVALMEVFFKNLTSGFELPAFKMYPGPGNDFLFNVCVPIRALQPVPNHMLNNNLQNFEIKFKVIFVNTTTAAEEITLQKYFVRGGRQKNGNDEWYLSSSQELIIYPWVNYGFDLPGFAQRIQGGSIVDFIPTVQFTRPLRGCDHRILKFLNSIGGYQYFVFEKFEYKVKSKAGKTIDNMTMRLRQDRSRNFENDRSRIIELYTKTPIEMQPVFSDLVDSLEVFLYNPLGSDNEAKWERLLLDNNESVENNIDRVFDNKISFEFTNYVTKSI